MPEETKPSNQEEQNGTTIEELTNLIMGLKTELETLKKENSDIKTEMGNLRAVNTTLLTSSHTKTEADEEAKERHAKFARYLKGE